MTNNLRETSDRYNLDPFGYWTDKRLWEVLDIAQLKSLVSDLKNGLG